MKVLNGRKKIFIFTNGCSRRKLDVQRLENYFKLNNCKVTKKLKKADYIIFVSCAFIKQRTEESLQIIVNFKKYDSTLIIAGCLPDINRERLNEVFKGKTISTKNLDEIDKIFPEFRFKFSTIPDANFTSSSFSDASLIIRTNKAKLFSQNYLSLIKNIFIKIVKSKFLSSKQLTYFLRIQDGCLGGCTYCSIRKAIGPLKSKPLKTCIEEYKQMISNGYKNFVILGDDVGAYGLDVKSTLPKLLWTLSKIDKNSVVTWSIRELHPKWIVKYDSELLKLAEQKKIKYILCGVQSGSDRILQLMNRYHDSDNMIRIFKKLKEVNPSLKLSAQIIIGFPSETRKDFLATLDLIKNIKFDEVFIYSFSKNEETPAANLKDQISDTTKRKRIEEAMKFFKEEKIKFFYDGA